MTELDALNFIHALPRLRHGEAAARMPRLLELLGHPETGLPFIHVTGTNGKGSFSAMTAAMLRAAGKKAGLFISPYIVDYRERMQINGEYIPGADLARLTGAARPAAERMAAEGTPAGEFMFGLGIALLWFREQKTDIAVIEAGIGGAGDATIALGVPVLSALMGIGLEHTALLGPTIREIARDKAAVIKGNPALLYPEQPPEAMEEIARRCAGTGAALHIPGTAELEIRSADFSGSRFAYGGEDFFCPLAGLHQVKNAVTAITAGRLLGLPEAAVRQGLAEVRFPARMEKIADDPLTIVDGAHNPHGMRALAESIRALNRAGKPVYALAGMMADKAVDESLSVLGPVCARLYAVTPDSPRAMESGALAAAAGRYCPAFDAGYWREGLQTAREAAGRDGALLLICGSLFLAGDVLREM